MNDVGNIQWFPGHMTKTKRLIEADLKMVDAVVEITDARIPESSRNPILDDLVKDKPRIILMNKCDYADENATRLWKQYYEKRGIRVLTCDCRSGKGLNRFLPEVKTLLADLIERRKKRGMIGKALRLMVVGIPNVGKSSFINRMAKTKKTKVGDKPGVTRGKQWVSIDKDVELLDMPGILWPKFDDQSVGMNLAYTGAVKDDILDVETLGCHLMAYLGEHYPDALKAAYKLSALPEREAEENDIAYGYRLLEAAGKKRGFLISGGEVDTERMAKILLDEFRSAKLGRFTLELP